MTTTCPDCGQPSNRGGQLRAGVKRCLACQVERDMRDWRYVSADTKRRNAKKGKR